MIKNMKKIKKIGLSAGVIAAALPLSTAFAMKVETRSSQSDWKDFVNKIYDKSYKSPLTDLALLKIKFEESSFKNKYTDWSSIDQKDIFSRIIDLFDERDFTEDEKIKLSKLILNDSAISNLFPNLGLKSTIVSDEEQVSQSGKVTNPVNSNAAIKFNGNLIGAIGKSGISKEWKENKPMDSVYTFSNQDQVNIYIDSVFKMPEFKNLIEIVDSSSLLIMQPNKKVSFSSIMVKIDLAISVFRTELSKISNKANKAIQLFDYLSSIGHISDFQSSDDIDIFEKLHNSDLMKNILSKEVILQKISDFKNHSEFRKNLDIATTLNLIHTYLNGLYSFKSEFDYGNLSNDKIIREQLIRLSSDMILETQLANVYQLRSKKSVFNGGIYKRIGIDNTNDFKMYNFNKLKYIDLSKTNMFNTAYEYHEPITKPLTIDYETIFSKTISRPLNGNDFLKTSTNGIMYSGSNKWFNLHLELTHKDRKIPIMGTVRVHENDNDSNGAMKNVRNVTSVTYTYEPSSSGYPAIGNKVAHNHTTTIKNPFVVEFVKSGILNWMESSVISKKDFNFKLGGTWSEKWKDVKSEYVDFPNLNEAFTNNLLGIIKELNDKINKSKTTHEIDGIKINPIDKLTFEINFNSIDFNEVYFDTHNDRGFDDTHSSNFRFKNSTIKWDYKIIEQKI